MSETRRPFADAKQVGNLLGVRPETLMVQRHRGQAPGNLAFKVGGQLRWDLDEVDAYLADAKARR